MVQEPRRNEPLHSCIVPLASLTGNHEEELMALGQSVEVATSQAEQMLADNYGCNAKQIQQLMQLARVEYVSPWCSQE